jgi:exopolysaccharide biosynthesis polyprenyl glycosylphosphotransferase
MIPRRIFWVFDVFVLGFAFLIAYGIAPVLQWLLVVQGVLPSALQEILLPPAVGWLRQSLSIVQILWILFTMILSTILFMELWGGYIDLLQQSRTRIVVSSMLSPLIGLSLIALIEFALKDPGGSRLFAFSFAILGGFGLSTYRFGMRSYFLRRQALGFYAENVILIGSPAAITWMKRYFAKNIAPMEYNLLGYLQILSAPPLGDEEGQGGNPLASLGTVAELGDLLIHRPIHEVIVISPETGCDWLGKIIQDCDKFRIALSIIPEAILYCETHDLKAIYRQRILGLPAIVFKPLQWDSEALFFKRLIDIVGAGLLLLLLLPAFAIIALAIKLTTPHLPVLYPWRVVGRNGVDFTGYKFTTMIADADDRKSELAYRNEMSGPVFKIKDDPRTTRLGYFLRKFSLNELPQLWSVLKGDMSLVGPRPAFRHELDRYEFWHKRKLSIRPGMTCLWQVRGRNKISNFDDWVKMDLEYIDKWSLWLDFKILFWTVWAVVSGTGS